MRQYSIQPQAINGVKNTDHICTLCLPVLFRPRFHQVSGRKDGTAALAIPDWVF